MPIAADCFTHQRAGTIAVLCLDAAGHKAWLKTASTTARRWLKAQDFTAKPGSLCLVPDDHGRIDAALWGISEGDRANPWCYAALAQALPAGSYRLAGKPPRRVIEAAALGWALAHYRFERYRASDDATLRRLLLPRQTQAVTTAGFVALARDLINTPANDLGPAALAQAVREVAQAHGARCRVIVGDDLISANFPAVHAVGRAAHEAPRLIDMHWGRAGAPKLTLVGKGVCFDSGGLDLKPSSAMLLMKKDMGGAANALALAGIVMAARLDVQLRLIIPAVENAVSANAIRPGDVIATRKGLTVEIGNTDAEGRLILGDALALADEDAPDLLLDFATLTGAARVALGPDLPALFSNDDDFAAALLAAGTEVGDPLWRLPLWPGYQANIKSPIADLNNAGEGGMAGAITAALYLEHFVERAKSWSHIDLYAWNNQARPGRPKGGEAMAIRAVFAVLERRFGRKN